MPRWDDVFSRTLAPKLGMLTFRSCFGWQCDRAEAASTFVVRFAIVNSPSFVPATEERAGDAACNLSPPIATEGRKSRSYGDRKVTGKDTYAAETLTWRLATLEMEMQHGSTGGASVPRGCIQECRLGQS